MDSSWDVAIVVGPNLGYVHKLHKFPMCVL